MLSLSRREHANPLCFCSDNKYISNALVGRLTQDNTKLLHPL